MRRIVLREGDQAPSKGTVCNEYSPEEESRTRQSERDDSDINKTIKKYNLQPSDFSRLVAGWSGRALGEFGDVSEVPSFAEMLATVNRAREAFMQFAPEVRAFFKNDPAYMLDCWQNGQCAEVFEEMGLLKRLPDDKPRLAAEREARVNEVADGVRRGSAKADVK